MRMRHLCQPLREYEDMNCKYEGCMKILTGGLGFRNHLPTEALASANNLYNGLGRYIGIGFRVFPPLRVEPGWEMWEPFSPDTNRVMSAHGETVI